MMGSHKEMQNQNLCLEGRGYVVLLQKCTQLEHQKWEHTKEGFLKHITSGQCLSSSRGHKEMIIEPCDIGKSTHLWKVELHKP